MKTRDITLCRMTKESYSYTKYDYLARSGPLDNFAGNSFKVFKK